MKRPHRLIDDLPPYFKDNDPDIYWVGDWWEYINKALLNAHNETGQLFHCEVCTRQLFFAESRYAYLQPNITPESFKASRPIVRKIAPPMLSTYHNHIVICGTCHETWLGMDFLQWCIDREAYLSALRAKVGYYCSDELRGVNPATLTPEQLAYYVTGLPPLELPQDLRDKLDTPEIKARHVMQHVVLKHLYSRWVVSDFLARFSDLGT